MNISDIKKIMISSLEADTDTSALPEKLEENGVTYSFSNNFTGKVLDKLFHATLKVNKQVEFIKYLNFAFYRIALPGVAAIILLLLSIYFMEGSLSINSLLGLSDKYDESIISLLTGN